MTYSRGLSRFPDETAEDDGGHFSLEVVETWSGISTLTSCDSSPFGQMTTVASKLANVQISPRSSATVRMSGSTTGLDVAPSIIGTKLGGIVD